MEQISSPHNTVYPVDPEHSGIRFTVVVIFIVIWALSYTLVRMITAAVGIDIIAITIGFVVTILLTQQIEKRLKNLWPSGRKVEVAPQHVRLTKKSRIEDEVDPRKAVNVLLWHFKISKRSRVRKGWFVVACALEQDETYITVYTFMSPEDFDKLRDSHQFTALRKPDKDAMQSGSMQLAGIQRRLHEAEKIRWYSGAEMTMVAFQQYLTTLQDSFPQWMPSVI